MNPVLLGLTVLAVTVGIVAPLGTLGFVFWHWHKELSRPRIWRKKMSDPHRSFLVAHASLSK